LSIQFDDNLLVCASYEKGDLALYKLEEDETQTFASQPPLVKLAPWGQPVVSHGRVSCMKFVGDMALAGHTDGAISCWSITSDPQEPLQQRLTLPTNYLWAECLSFNRDPRVALVGYDIGWLKMWDVEKGKCVTTFTDPNNATSNALCVQCDDNMIASGHLNGAIVFWDSRTAGTIRVLKDKIVKCLQYDLSRNLLVNSSSQKVSLWDLRKMELMQTLTGHTSDVRCLQFEDDTLVTGSRDRHLRVWDLKQGVCMHKHSQDDWISSLQFDHRKIISSGKTITVYGFQ